MEKVNGRPYALVLNHGGIGDLICFTPGLRYAIESNPQISGVIVTPSMFAELAQLWLSYLAPRFRLIVSDNWAQDERLEGYKIIVPTGEQFANVNSVNSFALGFLYYAQTTEIPKEAKLPVIRGDEFDLSNLGAGNYVVITTQATVESRKMPEHVIGNLVTGLCSRGYNVIFLGTGEPLNFNIPFTLDLRNKTTITEAAVIMAGAQGVFGLDNGLLHLAKCSRVPVFTLFTTIEPRLRHAPRQEGAHSFNFSVDPKKLPCLFCNAKMRYTDIDFTKCYRKHYECANGFDPQVMLKTFDTYSQTLT